MLSDACNTFPCKSHDASKGPGYCGDANQHWTLNSDGTLAVQTQPTAMCAAAKGFGWSWCSDKSKPMVDNNPCPPACLVAPDPPSTAKPEIFSGKGRTCVNRGGGWGGAVAGLLVAVGVCYTVGGMLANLKANGMPPAREIGRLLPHRPFWSEVRGLVNDGIALTRRQLTGTGVSGVSGGQPRSDGDGGTGRQKQKDNDSSRAKHKAAKDGKSRGGKTVKEKATKGAGVAGGAAEVEEPLLESETEREKEIRLGREVSEHVDAFGRTLFR
eukprot:SAG31_NODE_1861_length_7044_cov_169.866379_4_plen_270_part_00